MSHKWLMNIADPREAGAEKLFLEHQGQEEWNWRVEFLKGKTIGSPRAYAEHSTSRLVLLGIVGIYEKEAEPEFCTCGHEPHLRQDGCRWYVGCRWCGAAGTGKWNREDAIVAWNKKGEA